VPETPHSSPAVRRRIGMIAARLFAAAITAAAARANAADPAIEDLSSMLAAMRSSPGVVADFTETKELALLSSPLVSTGTIFFIPPRRFVRVVTSPGHSRLVVDGDKVRMEESTGNKEFDLSASPVARQIVDSFVVLFNGDETRLRQLYEADFQPHAADEYAGSQRWHLHLVPRSMPLDRMIKQFDMTGTGAHIDRMESVEPDGDRTVTEFGRTDVAHHFSDKEIADLFGAPDAR